MILILSSALLALVVLSGCTGGNIIGRAEGWTPLAIDESIIYGDSTNFSNGIYRASNAYRNLGILDSAVAFSRKVLELDIILNNHDFIMSDYSLIGDIYYEMNELDSALAMYEKTFVTSQEDQNVSLNQKINFVFFNNSYPFIDSYFNYFFVHSL